MLYLECDLALHAFKLIEAYELAYMYLFGIFYFAAGKW